MISTRRQSRCSKEAKQGGNWTHLDTGHRGVLVSPDHQVVGLHINDPDEGILEAIQGAEQTQEVPAAFLVCQLGGEDQTQDTVHAETLS